MVSTAAPSRPDVEGVLSARGAFRIVLVVQGVYYLVTGLWPLFHLESFERVTGNKTDEWLVQTVGVLIVVIALALLAAASRGVTTLEIAVLGLGAAIAFVAVDLLYVITDVIPPVYLLDAFAQGALIVCWIALLAVSSAARRR